MNGLQLVKNFNSLNLTVSTGKVGSFLAYGKRAFSEFEIGKFHLLRLLVIKGVQRRA